MQFLQFALIIFSFYIIPFTAAQNTKISFILKGIERQNLNSSVIDQKIKMSSMNHWSLLDHYYDVLNIFQFTLSRLITKFQGVMA